MKSYCISHRKDVDGLGAAALVSAATGAELCLSDYDDLLSNLRKVPKDAEKVFLCDLGADNSDLEEFIKVMGEVASRGGVTYIDHHFLSPGAKARLRRGGVRVVHDLKDCSSMLAYKELREELPDGAGLVALAGAVTDYMDDSTAAKELMEQMDRQFVLLESTMLAFALSKRGAEEGFPERIAEELSKMKRPHEIEGVAEAAAQQLEDVVRLEEAVREGGRKLGKIAYMVTKQYSTGNVAKLLIGAFGVPVGIAMKEKQPGWYEVSLRGTSKCRANLGRTISKVSSKLGGSGGGHARAAGCRVPKEAAQEMLSLVERAV